jgi:hypothetical protein
MKEKSISGRTAPQPAAKNASDKTSEPGAP